MKDKKTDTAVLEDFENEIARLKEEIASVRIESEAIGALKKINLDRSFNDLVEAAVLFKIREAKSYKQGGMTWEEFCKTVGKSRRTVETLLEDVRPLIEAFPANFAGLAGVEFNKIRLLGSAIAANIAGIENGKLLYKDEIVSLTGKDSDKLNAVLDTIFNEYESLLERQKKEAQQLKSAHETELSAYKKKSAEYDDLRMRESAPEKFFEKSYKECDQQLEKIIHQFVNLDFAAIIENDKLREKYKDKVKTFKRKLDGCHAIMLEKLS